VDETHGHTTRRLSCDLVAHISGKTVASSQKDLWRRTGGKKESFSTASGGLKQSLHP
jgi:hypothetical protein